MFHTVLHKYQSISRQLAANIRIWKSTQYEHCAPQISACHYHIFEQCKSCMVTKRKLFTDLLCEDVQTVGRSDIWMWKQKPNLINCSLGTSIWSAGIIMPQCKLCAMKGSNYLPSFAQHIRTIHSSQLQQTSECAQICQSKGWGWGACSTQNSSWSSSLNKSGLCYFQFGKQHVWKLKEKASYMFAKRKWKQATWQENHLWTHNMHMGRLLYIWQ